MPLRFANPAPEAYNYPLLIRHLLAASLVSARDREIVYRDRFRMSYAQFEGRIGRLASALSTLGVEQGTTVAVLDWDSHRYLEAYFAVPMMGAVLQMVNVRLSPDQVRYTMDHATAEVALVHREFLPLIDELRGNLPKLRHVVVIDDGIGGEMPPDSAGEYEELLDAADPVYPFADFDENAIATMFYTTGTTGLPKAVCFSHRQLVLHTLGIKAPFGGRTSLGFGCNDVYMPMTPMFHVHAWGVPYAATMLGMKQVYPGRYDPALLLELRREEGATYSHCVPTILQMVMAEADRQKADLSGWMVTIGGSLMTHALAAEARKRGIVVSAGYGMSETCPMATMARPDLRDQDEADRIATICKAGVPVPLVHVRVVDEAMRDVPRDGRTRGEVVLRAPWLTPCYVGDDRASAALWRGGWLHTQDVGTMDGRGNLQIRDRLKDVIKSGGEWICSLTLENLIAPLPGVAEVSVIGVPHPRWDERPIAVIVPADPTSPPTLAAINEGLSQAVAEGAISRYALLDRVDIVDALPRTSVGKIDKKELRRLHSAAA